MDITKLAEFNIWAHRKMGEQIGSLPQEVFVRELGGSFGSIKATLIHILESDWLWLQRFNGIPLADLPPWHFETASDIYREWLPVQDEMLSVVRTEAGNARKKIKFLTRKGIPYELPLEDLTGSLDPPWRFQGAGAILLVHAYSMYVYFYLFVRAGLRGIDASVYEAAESLGAGRWRTLVQVVLPLLRPSIAGAALLVFLTSLASFSAPYLFGGGFRVMTTQLVSTRLNGDDRLAMVETLALTALALLALALVRRVDAEGQVGGSKGTPPAARRPWERRRQAPGHPYRECRRAHPAAAGCLPGCADWAQGRARRGPPPRAAGRS